MVTFIFGLALGLGVGIIVHLRHTQIKTELEEVKSDVQTEVKDIASKFPKL